MHPLLSVEIAAAVDAAVSRHLARPWVGTAFRDLDDRASHRCGIRRGDGYSVFIKYSSEPDALEQFTLECNGLRLLHDRSGVKVAEPVGAGVLATEGGALLMLEALDERSPENRTADDWRSIGRTLAMLHGVTAAAFGLAGLDGFFGPLRQDNRPVESARWVDFFRERRVEPFLAAALHSGHLPLEFGRRVEQCMDRLEEAGLGEAEPTLLHGDAQQNNFLSTDAGAVIVDASPFYGHPENDLAMVAVFQSVPHDVFDAYSEIRPVRPGFDERRELWRIPVYLAVIAVDGGSRFGRPFLGRLEDALRIGLDR